MLFTPLSRLSISVGRGWEVTESHIGRLSVVSETRTPIEHHKPWYGGKVYFFEISKSNNFDLEVDLALYVKLYGDSDFTCDCRRWSDD